MKKTILLVIVTLLFISVSAAALDIQNYDLTKDDPSYWFKKEASPQKLYRDLSFTRFSGVDTLLEIRLAKNDVVRLVYDSSMSFGDMNIVVLDPGDRVFAKLPSGVMDSLRIVCDKTGTYKIKLVGDGAWWGHVRVRIE